jgi:hypothetical protein
LRLASDTFAGPSDPLAAVVHAGVSKSVLTTWPGRRRHLLVPRYIRSGVADGQRLSRHRRRNLTTKEDETAAIAWKRACLSKCSGNLVHVDGAIPVLTAPPIYDDTRSQSSPFQNESPAERYIGESLLGDEGETDWFTGAATDSRVGWPRPR